jgi:serine/threonine-protein kinase HipA
MMRKKNRILNIAMNGISIGRLEKKENGGLIFTYDKNWLLQPGARPVSLSLPLIEQSFKGDVVYNFFDNLLPDNPLIKARIQAKFNVASTRPFDLLATIGKDCVGAIQITDFEDLLPGNEIKYKVLDEKTIADILRNYQTYPLGMADETDDFRISIAGAQEKSAFLYYKNKWNVPIGQTPTTHIFKMPIGFVQQMDLTDSCENEWLCAQIAQAFGLPVAKCEILQFEEVKVLSVERFDRKLSSDKKWIMRLPQEDMCQALGVSPNLKYQADGGPGVTEIMQLLLGAVDPVRDRDIFYRSQILFWLLAAIDGHAKNFSIFIEPEGKYQLTPLYDIMSACPLMAKKQLQSQKIKMAMALKGQNNHYYWHNIQRRHFIDTAKHANYSMERAEDILDEMLSEVETVIVNVSAAIPKAFPEQIANAIFEGMRHMKKKLNK